MKTKMIKVPFDVKTAKKITSGEIEGRIVTRDGRNVRVLCFDVKDEFRNIIALIDCGDIEKDYTYDNNGRYYERIENGKDLFLEVPEYLTFKDGDVIAFDGCDMVAILQGECGKTENGEYFCKTYVVTNSKNKAVFLKLPIITNEARKATEEEKQKLIAALKASTEPKAKEYLKRFFGIEKKPELNFKPFDKVLVREDDDDFWRADFFSNMEDDIYSCIGNFWEQCIPYRGNEHLLGTMEKPE